MAVLCLLVSALWCSQAVANPDDDQTGRTEIRQMTPMHFGQIGRPTFGVNVFTLGWQNNSVTTGGTGDGFHLGGSSSGRYRVQGQPNQAITIGAHLLDFSADGLVVDEVHLNGDDNTHSTVINGQGYVIVRLGGVVTVEPQATPGEHYADILITVDFE